MHGKVIKRKKKNNTGPEQKLDWKKLQDGQCPKCENTLAHNDEKMIFHCSCGFAISDTRFRELTSSFASGSGVIRRKKDQPTPEENNQNKLNELG